MLVAFSNCGIIENNYAQYVVSIKELMKKYDKYLEYLTNDEDQSGLEGKPTYRNKVRLVWGFGLILLLLVILSFRMGYWQIVRADDLRERAVDIQKVDSEIDSVRGAI